MKQIIKIEIERLLEADEIELIKSSGKEELDKLFNEVKENMKEEMKDITGGFESTVIKIEMEIEEIL